MAQQDDYPRPDFRRSSLNWYSLNGPWDFAFDDADLGLDQGWQRSGLSTSGASKRTIQVPFVFQCEASGINERGVHEVLWYEKDFEVSRMSYCCGVSLVKCAFAEQFPVLLGHSI